jgi:hypothetical protein
MVGCGRGPLRHDIGTAEPPPQLVGKSKPVRRQSFPSPRIISSKRGLHIGSQGKMETKVYGAVADGATLLHLAPIEAN